MTPIRFSSGADINQDDYDEFWGWRLWAERYGLPGGEISREDYDASCTHRFGGVPALMPREGSVTHGHDQTSGQRVGQNSIYPEL